MSHIVFGCYDSEMVDSEKICELKRKAQEKGIFLWFDKEVNFYPDVPIMMKEQQGKIENLFVITSQWQRYNSDDLLFPYDKYTNEQLFSDETREYFSLCCKKNLDILFWCLFEMVQSLHPKKFEVFVTEGYDCSFVKKIVDLKDMEADILTQVLNSFFIESCIYQTIV